MSDESDDASMTSCEPTDDVSMLNERWLLLDDVS